MVNVDSDHLIAVTAVQVPLLFLVQSVIIEKGSNPKIGEDKETYVSAFPHIGTRELLFYRF